MQNKLLQGLACFVNNWVTVRHYLENTHIPLHRFLHSFQHSAPPFSVVRDVSCSAYLIKHNLSSALVGSSYSIFWQEYFCEVHWLGKWVTGLPSRFSFVVREPCPRLIHNGVKASTYMDFLGRVRDFAVWLMEIGTAKGEQKSRTSAALSKRGAALGPTPLTVISAQDCYIWILCRTQEHLMCNCHTLCTQVSMLSSNERSTCIFSKRLQILRLFGIKKNSFSWKGWRPFLFP